MSVFHFGLMLSEMGCINNQVPKSSRADLQTPFYFSTRFIIVFNSMAVIDITSAIYHIPVP